MIYSRERNFVFFEVPNTASTATAAELVEHYGGIEVPNRKHHQFGEAKRLFGRPFVERAFTFCCVRNPLDIVVTRYEKIRTNHKGIYTDPAKQWINGGQIPFWRGNAFKDVQNGMGFAETIRKYPRLIHASWLPMVRQADFVMRFERLQDDFARALSMAGLKQKRPLPRKNATAGKRHFLDYYDETAREIAHARLGPLMEEFGYEWPWDRAQTA